MMTSLLVSLLLSGSAHAVTACEGLAARAASVKGDAVASTFADLARCDGKLAEKHFVDFMRASTDVGTLVALSLAAIDAQLYQPVWTMMEKVPDIGARVEVAKGVGAHCADHPDVLPFLQGAYSALGDRQFTSWRDALSTCEVEAHDAWLEAAVRTPPRMPYDEKYNSVSDAYVKRKGPAALPALEVAGLSAGATGPFSTVLDRMTDAIRPASFGAKTSPEDQQRLEEALVRVATAVPPEQARRVADRLYQSGAKTAAASLLPRIYPDRVQGGGRMLYGVAAVERCDAAAVVHYATVLEGATRWSIVADVTPLALEAFKPKLKCTASEPWPIMVSPEPATSKSEVDAWAAQLAVDWSTKGVEASVRAEKGLDLP